MTSDDGSVRQIYDFRTRTRVSRKRSEHINVFRGISHLIEYALVIDFFFQLSRGVPLIQLSMVIFIRRKFAHEREEDFSDPSFSSRKTELKESFNDTDQI